MDTVSLGSTPPASIDSKPAQPAAPAAKPAPVVNPLKTADKLDLSDDIQLKDFSQDLKTQHDEFLGYRQMFATSDGKKANVYGVQYGRGTDLKAYGPVRLGYVWSGTFGASGESLHLGGDFGGKAFLGTEKVTQKILPGMPIPLGVYVSGGATTNLSNFNGDTSAGVGVYGAAGIDVYGINVEVRDDVSTNYHSIGFRAGAQIRF